MLENGKIYHSFDELKNAINKGDMDVNVKAGIVIQGNMGSLIALREAIQHYAEQCCGGLIYYTITAQPLYIVHYNDLSLQKQEQINKKKANRE